MNALSWLIYLVGMVTNLNAVLGFVSGAAGVAVVVILIFKGIAYLTAADNDATEDKAYVAWQSKFSKYFKWVFTVLVVSTLLSVVIPQRQTMIMIAASEVSERVVKTETMQNALNDVSGVSKDAVELLKEYIKSETDKLKASVIPEQKKEK